MSAHTPGPWTYAKQYGLFRISAPRANVYDIATGISDEPDARLIASAPELLEALQRIVDLAGWDDRGFEMEEARAAIAKAKGEAS